jgi:hypothetical protein
MELTLNDLRDLLAPAVTNVVTVPTGTDPLDPAPGDALLIRTVTMTLTGRVVDCSGSWIVLDQAAWIADTGRFANAIATGTLSEVEPMGDGVRVARGAIVDVTPWRHALPMGQK